MFEIEKIIELCNEVLDRTDLDLRLDAYTLEEELETESVEITIRTHDAHGGEKLTLSGKGVGVVDASFGALKEKFSKDYPSLTSIAFHNFSVHADIPKSNAAEKRTGVRTSTGETAGAESQSAALVEVCLTVINSAGKLFEFSDRSPSISRSSINVVLKTASFFVNSERAFVAVYKALQHAKSENRVDSIERYTRYLATLVEATSYSSVIEQLKTESL